MADLFDNEIKRDLEERGFTNDQIEILESFERDKYGLHSDIEKMMDDYDMTPDEIMNEFNEEPRDSQGSQSVEAAQSVEAPQQGGKRKSKKSRKSKKNKKSKRIKKNKKTKRNRKNRRSRRR